MPLGMEVGLGPGHIVLDGDPARPSLSVPRKGHSRHPSFRPTCIVAKRSPISAAVLILCSRTFILIGEYVLLLW